MLSLEDAAALSAWYRAPRRAESSTSCAGSRLRCLSKRSWTSSPPNRRRPGSATSCATGVVRCSRPRPVRASMPSAGAIPPTRRSWPTIPDAPFVLWLKGQPACFAKPAVAIVGSRAATPYGLEAASRLAGDLAAAGRRGRQRPGARRRLGGPPGRAGGRWRHRGRARLRRRRHLPARARAASRPRSPVHGARRLRAAAGDPAGCLPFSRAKPYHQRPLAGCRRGRGGRAERLADHRRAARWNRAGTSWRCPGASSPAATAAATPSSATVRRWSNRPRTCWRRCGRASLARPAPAGRDPVGDADPVLAVMLPGESYDIEALGAETGRSAAATPAPAARPGAAGDGQAGGRRQVRSCRSNVLT